MTERNGNKRMKTEEDEISDAKEIMDNEIVNRSLLGLEQRVSFTIAPDKNSSSSVDVQVNKTSSDYYFDSYSHFGIHEDMLKDEIRTRSYMNAINDAKDSFRGKIVLDIGCGTGILSMFAASAGASKVYAVECSSIVEQCREIIIRNGFMDVIEVIAGKMEDIALPVNRVDIIISEWMGYFLLYESMIHTIIYARDKYLHPSTGLIFPDSAQLYVCGIEDRDYRQSKLDFWNNVYGFNMDVMKELAIMEPLVDFVEPQAVMTNSQLLLSLNLMTCKKEDTEFTTEFTLIASRHDTIHAMVGYFDYSFTQIPHPILVSTSPFEQPTHWKQTVWYLQQPQLMSVSDRMQSQLTCHPNAKNIRDLDVTLNYSFDGSNIPTEQQVMITQSFRLR